MKTIDINSADIKSTIDRLAKLQGWIRRSGRKYVNGEIDMDSSSAALSLARSILRRVARKRALAEKVEVFDAGQAQ